MPNIRSVFIVEPVDQGWIIERLMRDLSAQLNQQGIHTRIGTNIDYQGEDVIFNSRYLIAFSDPRAKVNALLITHIDDVIKEMHLKSCFNNFNSFICMSPHDADFISALKSDARGVVGIDLPTRDLKVRPIRLAMFSARYEDGRKNEDWIYEYFLSKSPMCRQSFTFCFLGWGWETFCAKLSVLEMNYEIYRYSRFTPGEFELYKEVLASANTLIYLGYDGGSMSVYDAISAGINVLVPNCSYHRGLGEEVNLFDDKAQFFAHLDRLQQTYLERHDALARRSLSVYSSLLISHWNSVSDDIGVSKTALTLDRPLSDKEVIDKQRINYSKLNVSRIRSALIRLVQSWLKL